MTVFSVETVRFGYINLVDEDDYKIQLTFESLIYLMPKEV